MNIKKLKIKVNYLTLYFLLILFLCGYIKNALIIFGIVIFHELGHILISIILGYKIKSVELFPFGGITKIDNIYKTLRTLGSKKRRGYSGLTEQSGAGLPAEKS